MKIFSGINRGIEKGSGNNSRNKYVFEQEIHGK